MEKSFRDILSGLLEEEAPARPSQELPHQAGFSSETSFFWQGPRPEFAPRGVYKTANSLRENIVMMVKPEPPPAPQPAPESVISLSQLNETDRNLTQTLIRLGATELSEGLSERRLKKAFRRLAKRLHPDMNKADQSSRGFMELHEAYEKLSSSLNRYASAR
jgi:hypothetical protein